MSRFLKQLMTGIALSFYLFPIAFTFLPSTINTKMMLAVLGVILLVFNWLNENKIILSKELLGATGIVTFFSIICYFSADYSNTADYSYANYFTTFFVWLGAAYAVCTIMGKVHGYCNLRLLTFYAVGVCFIQCVAAIMIDRIPEFQHLVDSVVNQGQDFVLSVGRLYGIGASLDTAGIRFAIVLLMTAAVLSKDKQVLSSKKTIFILLIAFFTIAIIGDMIARTTSVGLVMAIIYFILNTDIFRLVMRRKYLTFHAIFGLMLLVVVAISAYLYNTDKNFHTDIRFAFEGFFNWVEYGEFRTSSTDKLNTVMWIWPKDLKTWIIGSGRFGLFAFSSDIGYCRFILYCGLTGFSVFASLFVYNATIFAIRYKMYRDLFVFLLAYTFIVWIKVSTDIFFFICIVLLYGR